MDDLTAQALTPPVNADSVDTYDIPEEFSDFTKAKAELIQMIGEWSSSFAEAVQRREERYVDLDAQDMRDRGQIASDQTFIPDRVIDGNIRREKSETIAFLNAGYRIGIFKCISNPEIDTQRLEQEVTDGLTYSGWQEEFQGVIDGAALHGMDYMEVILDLSKPLHVSFEHVGYDKLCYNRKVKNIQNSEWLLRKYSIEVFKLEQEFTQKYGFNADEIAKLTDTYQNARRNDSVTIWKAYRKCNGVVWVAWFSENKCGDWLQAPKKLRMGIYTDEEYSEPDVVDPATGMVMPGKKGTRRVPVDIDKYPIFTNLYNDDENDVLVEHFGRAFLDWPQQEANTAIITGYVNQTTRAQAIYASPKLDDGESASMVKLDIKLEPDGIYSKALEFWNMPNPDVNALQALQILDNKNAVQNGQVAFAANNRKDSRKTAKELDIAQTQQSKITSVGLAGFSSFLRNVLEFTWAIVQSQAIDEKIKLLLIQLTTNNNGIASEVWVNDIKTLREVYDIRPAGDTDVIEAQAEQQKMMQDWPVVQTTPIAQIFLEDYIRLRYPQKAKKYIEAMQQGDVGKKLIGSLMTMATGLMEHPNEIATMSPQDKAGMISIIQQAQQYLQPPQHAK